MHKQEIWEGYHRYLPDCIAALKAQIEELKRNAAMDAAAASEASDC